MVVMAPRESWTDERLDDLAKQMVTRFNVLERHMDARFSDLTRTIQILFGVVGIALTVITAMLVGVISLIVTHF
jgi:tetrahydromethanopterin S-methyltransferase subunit G